MEEQIDLTQELPYFLALNRCPDVGPVTAAELLRRFGGSARALFEAGGVDLGGRAPLGYFKHPDWAGVERDLAWAQAPDHHLCVLGDPDYPPFLREIGDAPLVLYVLGTPAYLHRPQVAVVGSRSASATGAENAYALAQLLSDRGMTITSGLALGIDAAAHRGGLAGASGTVAVAATGLDRVYPARHRELAHAIAAQGVLVSEFPLGTPPLSGHFPRRNRVISGLSLGTLVVEAALRSGSLITARLAGEQGREVFAVPGSIHNPQARGCHLLIRQGAKLVETADDILEELAPALLGQTGSRGIEVQASGHPEGVAGDEGRILMSMGFDAVSIDVLVARTGLTADKVSSILTTLEMQGQVAGDLSGRYERLAGKV